MKWLPLSLLGQLILSSAQAQNMTGRYVGRTDDGPAVLVIRQDAGGAVTGSLTTDGVSTPFTGRVDGNRLSAKVKAEGQEVPFSGELHGSTLTLTVMGERLAFTKAGAADTDVSTTPTPVPTSRPDPKTARPPSAGELNVRINGVRLDAGQLANLQRQYHLQFVSGDFWYDRRCGAWGVVGQPASGVVAPGIQMGGELRADASRGNSGVFVNGRELTMLEVAYLQQLGPVQRGRAWLDAMGNFGPEGGPAIGNLYVLAQMRSVPRQGVLSTYDKTGVAVFKVQ